MHSFLIQLYLLQFKKLTKINIFCLLRNVDVKLMWPMGKHPGWVRLCWAGELCPDQLLFGKQKKKSWEKNRTESYFRGTRLKSQTCTQRIRVGGILGFADMPYPWFSPTARAIIIPRGCGRACWAAEKCKKKKERKLIFRLPSLGPVCQARLDHSLVTDGCKPCRPKNPSQKFTEVHGSVGAASRARGRAAALRRDTRARSLKTAPRSPRNWGTAFPASQNPALMGARKV